MLTRKKQDKFERSKIDIKVVKNSNEEKTIWSKSLENILIHKKWLVGGVCEGIINSINIDQFGPVSIPPRKDQIKQFFKIFKKEASSDSIYIDSSQLQINSQSWDKALRELVEKVKFKLNYTGDIEIKLDKMLIHGVNGCISRNQQQTSKNNKTIARCYIQLPSFHEGGELVAYYGNEESICNFGKSFSALSSRIHCAAFDANLEHEILPVKSGYQVILVYSFIWLNNDPKQELESNLMKYLKYISVNNKKVCLCLQNNNFLLEKNGLTLLKGIDLERLRLLIEANDLLAENEKLAFNIAVSRLHIVKKYKYKSKRLFEKYNLELTDWFDDAGKLMIEGSKRNVDQCDVILNPDKETSYKNIACWRFLKKDIQYKETNIKTTVTYYNKCFLVFWPKRKKNLLALDSSSENDSSSGSIVI